MRYEIEEWIKSKEGEIQRGTYWLKVIDDNDGQPCLRTYALNSTKKAGIRVKEVLREYLDGQILIHGDLYWCGAGGYQVMWEPRKSATYYLPYYLDDTWYPLDKRPRIYSIYLFSKKAAENLLKKYIPYFVLPSSFDNLMEYAIRYNNYASAEQLVKAGFGWLVMDKRCLKLSGESKKKFVRWLMIKENSEYVKDHKTSYSDIAGAIKRNITIERVDYERCIDRYEKAFKEANIQRTRKECEDVYDYLNGSKKKKPQKIGLRNYIDYLNMAKDDGLDMTLKSTIYPLNAHIAHDTLANRRKIKESQEINEKLEKIFSLLKDYAISQNDLKIVIPHSQKEFVEWGKQLKICVGSYGYDKKMSKGDCIILMVYRNDEPLECCELQKRGENKYLSIVQLRGLHNQSSSRHKDCEKLVNKFIHNYENQNLIGACI